MSTGLNCEFVEVRWNNRRSEWFYILEDWSSPKGAVNWREYAYAYGPFDTEEEADEHLAVHHANPGGSYTAHISETILNKDPVLKDLIEKAPQRTRDLGTGWRPG